MGERIDLVKRAFAGEAVERIPVMAHNFLMAVREAGFTQKQFRESPDVMVKAMTEATMKYDLDCVLLDVGTALLASACGADVMYPDDLAAVAKERETRLAADLKARGIPFLCHICGDVNPILPDLVETGCPAFELDWKTDANRVFEVAHGKFTLSGNVDPALFVTGTPDEVYAASKKVCDLFRGKGGLVLCSGCALGPNTKSENLQAFVRASRETCT